ncbi:MAG: type I-E CRISPR-associated protein Cas7/Cse4/CasC, partial [Chloroflexi bacterium]|nr:type I-E CRISPR-associated protein Cas7/Cse4/CasC [Chloroflexota bacterium]
MFVELHIVQNFAPSNLNRDDTGAPKDCEFGGCRRARISSQCLKRAMHTAFEKGLLPVENVAKRSKRFRKVVGEILVSRGRNATDAERVFDAALGGLGILSEQRKDDEDAETLTEVLLFADQGHLERFAEVCDESWETLSRVYEKVWAPKKGKKASKDEAKKAVPEQLKKALSASLDGSRSADIALFGRMLADLPERNVDAASQVAHAISTHKVSVEFDFYTAVDDLKPEDTAGADMLGTVEFNSACFYRYANVDLAELARNLGGDEELARATLEAYLRAAVSAVPTGKQNS